MSAIDIHARASKDFDVKLAETKALLRRAASALPGGERFKGHVLHLRRQAAPD